MLRYGLLAMTVLMFATVSAAFGADSVIVESRTVAVGEEGVDINVRLVNSDTVLGLTVPLVVREVSGGAFVTDVAMFFEDRLDSSLTDYHFASQYTDTACTSNVPGTNRSIGFCNLVVDSIGANYTVQQSPHALLFSGLNVLGPP